MHTYTLRQVEAKYAGPPANRLKAYEMLVDAGEGY